MPENNTTPETPVTAAPASMAPVTFSTRDGGMNTTENIMGATFIENKGNTKSSTAIWIGFGLILIAMIVAGAYYYMTTIQPDVAADVPVVNIPTETDTQRAERDLEAINAELEASIDFSEVDTELDAITSDLNTVQ